MSEADGVEETIGLAQQEGGVEGTGGHSRSRRSSRLSRVSFATTIKPGPRNGDATAVATHSASTTPQGSLGQEVSPLLGRVWSEPQGPSTPPRGLRTLSADTVMLASGAASTPGVESYPTTPMTSDGHGQLIYPDGRGTPRPGGVSGAKSWHAKRSGTFISPSPFSSTVTAVVKDAFLRPIDRRLPRKSSMRRLRSSIRASLFFNDDEDQQQSGSSSRRQQSDVPTASEDNVAAAVREEGEEGAARGRSRSLSDTIGDYFRPKAKRKGPTESDVEDGHGEGS